MQHWRCGSHWNHHLDKCETNKHSNNAALLGNGCSTSNDKDTPNFSATEIGTWQRGRLTHSADVTRTRLTISILFVQPLQSLSGYSLHSTCHPHSRAVPPAVSGIPRVLSLVAALVGALAQSDTECYNATLPPPSVGVSVLIIGDSISTVWPFQRQL